METLHVVNDWNVFALRMFEDDATYHWFVLNEG